jgi:hypothetical protein
MGRSSVANGEPSPSQLFCVKTSRCGQELGAANQMGWNRRDVMKSFDEHSIFVNQNIVPAQFFPKRTDNARIEPLKRLAFAVLVDALHVFQSCMGTSRIKRRREFHEAREWLLGARADGPFSFENVCYLVDIDSSKLRRWLLTWQAKERAKLAQRKPISSSLINRSRIRMPVTGSSCRCTFACAVISYQRISKNTKSGKVGPNSTELR